MVLVVIGDALSNEAFSKKPLPDGTEVIYKTSFKNPLLDADAFFFLLKEDKIEEFLNLFDGFSKPFFVNAVIKTLNELPKGVIRINGWPGFWEGLLEISSDVAQKDAAENVLKELNWEYQFVPDLPGFISARIIAMIINEAYFALGDEVSTKEEIDIAMKLGTNYPYGPFEWSMKIGLKNVYELLTTLAETDARYSPAPLLIKETNA